MFPRLASLTLVRYLALSAAALAMTAWSQDIPTIQTNVTPVTIYQLKPAAPTTTLVYGNDFRVKLDRGQALPDGPIRVRVFEGPRDRLIDAANRTTLGDCIRYEPIFSTPAVVEDHTLYFPDVPQVSDLWVGEGGATRRFVLIPEDGKQPAGTVWLDRASAADYFNRGIEIEVGSGGREIPAVTLWTPDPYIVEHMPPATGGPGTFTPFGFVTSINCLKASGAAASGPSASMLLSVCEVGM